MSKAQHTAGPWAHEKAMASREVWHVRSKKQGCIASLEGKSAEANARLIAAAPDLLEALKAFNVKEHYIISGNAETLVVRVPITTLQAAAAAVAKAEAA